VIDIKSISILGSGWLGKPLAQHLCKIGYSVKASTTSEERIDSLKYINVEPFIFDIDNINKKANNFFNSKILIINIPSKNINSFRQLITEIEKSGISVVIFVSSTSVYSSTNKIVTETEKKGLVKGPLYEIENLFSKNGNFKTTIVRCGGLIGYSRNPGKFFRGCKIVQNPDAPINLIHRDDCIGIITSIIENEIWGEILNCCADTHPTKREFYTQVARSIGETVPEFSESNETSFKIVSNEKVKRILNYKFVHPDLMKIKFT